MTIKLNLLFLLLVLIFQSCNDDNWEINENVETLNVPGKYVKSFIHQIEIDNQGNLWIGTFADGLIKYDGTNFYNFTSKNSSLSNDSISCLFIDSNNDVYIGTKQGLNVLSNNKISYPTEINTEIDNGIVTSICIDKDNCLWLGIIDRKEVCTGVYVFNEEKVEFYNNQNSLLPSNTIKTIVCGSNNIVWIGTYQIGGKGGLVRIENKNWQVYTKKNSGLPYNSVDHIISLTDSTTVLASSTILYADISKMDGYVYIYEDDKNWIDISPYNSNPLISNRITSIKSNSDGLLVAATSLDSNIPNDRYDLSLFKDNRWITFDAIGYDIHTYIPDMEFDKEGNLWIVTPDNREIIKITNIRY
jgi:ligand-binding sensor domain-containing protein